MEVKAKNVSKKSRKSFISIILYVIATIVALMGVALLVNNILLFKSTVAQAVAQGYAVATVKKALLTSQLIPGVFEPVALYGGIAFLLLGLGVVNKKVSKCLTLLTKAAVCNDTIEESVVGENIEVEEVNDQKASDAETTELAENVEVVKNEESNKSKLNED